jgi:hypothetical protein
MRSWHELLPSIKSLDQTLIFDGMTPIARSLTFCESCGEWLPTSLERTQAEELIAAIRLVTAVPEFATARIEHADRPDVMLHLDGKIFGLEITRIVRNGPDTIVRAQWRRAVERRARALRREKSAAPVWVSVGWNPYPPQAKIDIVARLLVDLVERNIQAVPAELHAWTDIGPQEIPDDLAEFVHGLHIVRTREDDQWVSGFGNNPEVQPQELQQEINRKAAVVAGYGAANNGLWLLIYAEPRNAAQALDVTEEVRQAQYSGPFDRAFFLDCMDKVAELQLQAKGS